MATRSTFKEFPPFTKKEQELNIPIQITLDMMHRFSKEPETLGYPERLKSMGILGNREFRSFLTCFAQEVRHSDDILDKEHLQALAANALISTVLEGSSQPLDTYNRLNASLSNPMVAFFLCRFADTILHLD